MVSADPVSSDRKSVHPPGRTACSHTVATQCGQDVLQHGVYSYLVGILDDGRAEDGT